MLYEIAMGCRRGHSAISTTSHNYLVERIVYSILNLFCLQGNSVFFFYFYPI